MKKHHILLGVLLLIAVGLAGYSLYKYNHTPQGLTIQEVVNQRNAAQSDNAVLKQLSANDDKVIANLKATDATLSAQKAAICAQLKTTKLVQPACQ